MREAPRGTKTALELHVGSAEHGDVHEAELLRAAVHERRRGSRGCGMRCCTRLHANRSHNLVLHLRNSGELHEMLRGWLRVPPPAAPHADPAARSEGLILHQPPDGPAAAAAAALAAADAATLAAGRGVGPLGGQLVATAAPCVVRVVRNSIAEDQTGRPPLVVVAVRVVYHVHGDVVGVRHQRPARRYCHVGALALIIRVGV